MWDSWNWKSIQIASADDNNKKKIVLSSYNCRSLGETKYELVSELLANSDFCLLQEHWMYPERFLEVAKKEFKDIQCIVTSPMNENELTHGRPRGGTAILYNSKINAKVEKLDTGCNRLRGPSGT